MLKSVCVRFVQIMYFENMLREILINCHFNTLKSIFRVRFCCFDKKDRETDTNSKINLTLLLTRTPYDHDGIIVLNIIMFYLYLHHCIPFLCFYNRRESSAT